MIKKAQQLVTGDVLAAYPNLTVLDAYPLDNSAAGPIGIDFIEAGAPNLPAPGAAMQLNWNDEVEVQFEGAFHCECPLNGDACCGCWEFECAAPAEKAKRHSIELLADAQAHAADSISPVCSGVNQACLEAHRAGRPVRIVPGHRADGASLVLPTYHYATQAEAQVAVDAARAVAPTIATDAELYAARSAGAAHYLSAGWIDPTRR